MAKSVWDKLKDMMNTSSYPDGERTTARQKKKPHLMIIPDFTDKAIVNKYVSGLSSFDSNASDMREKETYKERVNTIVNAFFDNYNDITVKGSSSKGFNLKYKSFEIYISDSYISLCRVDVNMDGEDFRLPMNRYEIARAKFLGEYAQEQKLKIRDSKLDAMLGVTEQSFSSKKLKGGKIQISEEEILDSLLQTHPQHFI